MKKFTGHGISLLNYMRHLNQILETEGNLPLRIRIMGHNELVRTFPVVQNGVVILNPPKEKEPVNADL